MPADLASPSPRTRCASRYASARITSRCRSASARLFSPSAAPVGYPLPLRFQAAVDGFAPLVGRADALQAHVDHADADALQILVDLLAHPRHDLLALARHHLVHAADAELVAQRAGDGLADA